MKRLSSLALGLSRENKQLTLSLMSIFVGLLTGMAVVLLKNSTAYIEELVSKLSANSVMHIFYFVFPILGIAITLFIIKYIFKRHVGHDGIPRILYAITRKGGFVEAHNIFSSAITSAFTVGFGGSVGLEGPVVTTGGAIGSNIGRLFKLSHKQRILLIGSATAAAISAIFEAPISGIVFALEVMMVDLTTTSLIPLALGSITGSLTSIFISGRTVLYNFSAQQENLSFKILLFYIILGILTGLFAVYFSKTFSYIGAIFKKMDSKWKKFAIGSSFLGLLIFVFPPLYGEGYHTINMAISGDYSFLFDNQLFRFLPQNMTIVIILLLALTFIKVLATSLTFEAGGIGGIFAPTMFMGAMFGLALAIFAKTQLGLTELHTENSILVGMSALMAGIMQAPLTGIFLISEVTKGYELMLPLMISSIVSLLTVRIFQTNSVYTKQLSERGNLLTHNADKNALTLMNVCDLLETNFNTVSPENTLRELVAHVANSQRNVFPVVGDENMFLGIITLNDIRKIMFRTELYDKTLAKELMFIPDVTVNKKDGMESVAEKIQKSGKFNVAVIDDEGKYLGFVSRANVFSTYRNYLRDFSSL